MTGRSTAPRDLASFSSGDTDFKHRLHEAVGDLTPFEPQQHKYPTKSQALQLLRAAALHCPVQKNTTKFIRIPKEQFLSILGLDSDISDCLNIPYKCGQYSTIKLTEEVLIYMHHQNPNNLEKIAGMSLEEVQSTRKWEFAEEIRRAKQEEPSLPPRP